VKAWINIALLLILAIHSNPIFAAINPDSTNQWGYGYDSLLKDLNIWRLNPLVKVDSVGATSKGRAIWMVSITDSGDSLSLRENAQDRKHRIFIHARTHPSEVQANSMVSEFQALQSEKAKPLIGGESWISWVEPRLADYLVLETIFYPGKP
jgi:Zinc carboxypeptidase